MNPPRSTSAMMMPTRSTFCWWSRGTANADMIRTNTNRLSTDRLYSVNQPAMNSPAGTAPPTTPTSAANTRASTTYTATHRRLSRVDGTCGRRPITARSAMSRPTTAMSDTTWKSTGISWVIGWGPLRCRRR